MSFYLTADWPAPASVKAITTLKPFDCGLSHSANSEQILQQRQLLQNTFNLPQQPCWLSQVHGNTAIKANRLNQQPKADAAYTTDPQLACVVLTADCLPVLICNKQGTEVAAIHAGWRGLANGIIPATIAKLSSDPKDLLAWLGPAIGPDHFEVGPEVVEVFLKKDPAYQKAFKSHRKNHAMANIFTIAKTQLSKIGVDNCYGAEYCTVSDPERFFSYRRDQGKTGRLASLIWIEG